MRGLAKMPSAAVEAFPAHRAARRGHAPVHGDRRGSHLATHREQVRDLERRARGRAEHEVHAHHLVEAQRLAVLHCHLQHGDVEALGAQCAVGVVDRPQVLHAGLLQVGEVAAVVHDAHRIRLREPHPQLVHEGVVGGLQRRVEFQAHPGTVPGDR